VYIIKLLLIFQSNFKLMK